KQFNEVFGVDEIIWENKATLTQNITVKNQDIRYIKADLSYQVCAEMCINEEYYFVFDLKNKTAHIFTNYDQFKSYGSTLMPEIPNASTQSWAVAAKKKISKKDLPRP